MNVAVERARAADSAEILNALTAVPAPSDAVCPNCHTWKVRQLRWCENCEEVRAALGADPISASFVTLYAKPSDLRDWLTQYKGRPGGEDPHEREAEVVIEAIMARFLAEHGAALWDTVGPVDEVVVVPSTDRPPPHPLELLLARVAPEVPVSRDLYRTAEPIGFRHPNAQAYRADDTMRGRRVFLMDDVYTTGAHLNSAAAALRNAGAHVVGALVLARRVNPDYNDEARHFWASANRTPFAWPTGPYVAGELA